MNDFATVIESAYEKRDQLSPDKVSKSLYETIESVLKGLNEGRYRVAEYIESKWVTHTWIKKAILLYFLTRKNEIISGEFSNFYDKIPLKYTQAEAVDFNTARLIPPAVVRYGAYIGPRVILMPSYINIGAYVDANSMIDTWATVGSCAQIGKNVHISGGTGIGGVLEPMQENPTIIEDNCFIGARSEIVEGVIVEKNSVIGMGVFIGKSTKIYHRATGEILQGRIPEGSVVVSGTLPAKDKSHQLYSAIIVKQVDEQTRLKTSLNELLRD